MRHFAVIAAALALASCKTAAPSRAATAPTQAPVASPPASATASVAVAVSGSFSPQRGPAAFREFVADVPAQENGGECQVTRTGGSGATIATASYPARVAWQLQLTLTFDSTGHLIRYAEFRGVPPIPVGFRPGSGSLDSVLRENEARNRNTTINLDYGADRGIAMNRGGGRPTTAIMGTVREVERLERLGPPAARLERMRKLCGV